MRFNSSLQRGLAILEYITAQQKGARLSEVARVIGQPTSNTSIFINTLVEEGYIFKDLFTGSYHLTDKLGSMASLSKENPWEELKTAALPVMMDLHKKYNENVILSVINHSFLYSIQEISSTQSIRIINSEGERFRPHLTAAGKVILAFSSREIRDIYLEKADLAHETTASLGDVEKLNNEFNDIRNRGWSLNKGEYNEQIFGIAAPIITKTGVYALAVQYPQFRHDPGQIDKYANEVVKASQAISL